jgi:UDP-N-acetylmuramate--alanine ligase
MPIVTPKHVHLIGIGGINMSAVAKLLKAAKIGVSGSDAHKSELTEELEKQGIPVMIGHDGKNVPPETDVLVYSSAVPESNVERMEGRKRGLTQLTNFQFLGSWTSEASRLVLITGTHGKSTTTALTGLLLEKEGMDPTVVVGSRVPSFPDRNLRLGRQDFWVIEGDEYARHFLEFRPTAVVLNNIELDHTDVFPDIETMVEAFRKLLSQVRDKGVVIANADDARVGSLIGEQRAALEARGVHIVTFGFGAHADVQIVDHVTRAGEQSFALRDAHGLVTRYLLHVPGRMNVMNAAAAVTLTSTIGISAESARAVLGTFSGIWRRFEKIAEKNGITVISDYGHHPTAIVATLEAARGFYPGRRIVLAFQPHHRNRTKHLFLDFIPAFDRADALLLVEIYDVTGREGQQDADVSSRDLLDAVIRHDADRAVKRTTEFATDPDAALETLKRWAKEGDVVIVMGAGKLYSIAMKIV